MAFFNQHGCTTNAANAKYNSRAAQLYREKIKTLATQATRRHGTEVMLTPPSLFQTIFIFLFCLYISTSMFTVSWTSFTVRLLYSCGLTVKVLSLQHHQMTSRWISSVCIHRYRSVGVISSTYLLVGCKHSGRTFEISCMCDLFYFISGCSWKSEHGQNESQLLHIREAVWNRWRQKWYSGFSQAV